MAGLAVGGFLKHGYAVGVALFNGFRCREQLAALFSPTGVVTLGRLGFGQLGIGFHQLLHFFRRSFPHRDLLGEGILTLRSLVILLHDILDDFVIFGFSQDGR